MQTPLSFRVYPGSSRCAGLYAVVTVYPTLRALREAVRELDRRDRVGRPTADRNRLSGLCVAIIERRRRDQKLLPCFAWVYLSRTALGMSTITHECVHAGLRYLARLGVDSLLTAHANVPTWRTREETLANAVDQMASQIVLGCRRAGIMRQG